MLVRGATPSFSTSLRKKSVAVTSTMAASPGRTTKRQAPVAEGLSIRAQDDYLLILGMGPLQPEFPEKREFLPRRDRRVDRQGSCRQAITLPLADGAEITGTEEYGHLVVVIPGIDRIVQAKTGESEVGRDLVHEIVQSIAEKVGRKMDLLDLLPFDNVDADGLVI